MGTYRYIGTWDGTIHMQCNKCGEKKYPPSVAAGEAAYNPCSERTGDYVCGIPTTSYALDCGKTVETIEGYKVSY